MAGAAFPSLPTVNGDGSINWPALGSASDSDSTVVPNLPGAAAPASQAATAPASSVSRNLWADAGLAVLGGGIILAAIFAWRPTRSVVRNAAGRVVSTAGGV